MADDLLLYRWLALSAFEETNAAAVCVSIHEGEGAVSENVDTTTSLVTTCMLWMEMGILPQEDTSQISTTCENKIT